MKARGLGLMVLAVAATVARTADREPKGDKTPSACFSAAEFRGWKARDASTIYVHASHHRYFRLDLVGVCPGVTAPGARLVTVFRGTQQICSARDWRLRVAGPGVPATLCQVRSMTRLSAREIAAIPEDERP